MLALVAVLSWGALSGATANETATSTQGATVSLTADEFLAFAAHQNAQGNHALALQLAESILETRPQLYEAQLIRIDALIQLGRQNEGIGLARSVWRDAPSKAEKTRVARLAAVQSYKAGSTLSAKFWLRRALQTAPDPVSRANILRNFNEIRRHEPWKVNLSFSATPSSNINGGAESAAYTIDGLPWTGRVSGEGLALSGYLVSVSGDVRYRWSRPKGRLTAGVRFSQRFALMSSDAKTQAPSAENGDFDYANLDFVFGGTHVFSARHTIAWDASIGRTFSGGAPYADAASLSLTDTRALKSGAVLQQSARLRHEMPVSGSAPATALRYAVSTRKALENRADFQRMAYVEVQHSEAANRLRGEVGAGLSYAPAKPVLGTQARFNLGAAHIRYPDFQVLDPTTFPFVSYTDVPGGRRDTRLSVGAEFLLSEQSYLGFAPLVSVELGKTWSNVSRFETRNLSIGLGIRSTF